MDNYYVEVLDNIKKLIDTGKIEEAYMLVMEELKMPYIPADIEVQLHDYITDVKGLRNEKSGFNITIDQVETYLNGSDEQQLLAVNQLGQSNVRQNIDIVKYYLSKCTNRAAAALLIDVCIEQQIDETLVYHTDDIDYEFVPKYCIRPYDSLGFGKASVLISQWFESDDPSFFVMCMQMLIQCCFDYLPLSYDDEDSLCLALSVVKEVMCLMQYENEWVSFIHKMGFEDEKIMNFRH